MKKYIYWLLCSAVLLALLLLCIKVDTDTSTLRFCIEQDHEISIFESDDGQHYVFLPSYAKMETLRIVLPSGWEASLGGVPLENNMSCETFEPETPYPLFVNNQYVSELLFYQSANVSTMYIDTLSKTMDHIHEDKNNSEAASVALYTPEGILNSSDNIATFKGRGNATWVISEKRPYLLTLSSGKDLLNMGAAKKWILLANSLDRTNLNNKLVMDLAREAGLRWTPECRYVDLYLNGEYNGLYLLCERAEIGTSRLDLDTNSGDFLCKIDSFSRMELLSNPFKTNTGRTIEITSPDIVTRNFKSTITDSVNHMEEIIMSNSDLTKADDFDLDSWVRKYLIDEISGNLDADRISSYFYFSDGIFYGGPIWDYDMTFGNHNPRNLDPHAFIAKTTSASGGGPIYYDALYSNESFYNRVVELYQSDFLPLLNQMLDSGISTLAAEIQSAATMNTIRWPEPSVEGWNVRCTVDDLINYLNVRVSFLNSTWIDGTEYCTLQFATPPNGESWHISVQKGTLLATDYLDLESTTWINRITGDVVDFSQPITSDMWLELQPDAEDATEPVVEAIVAETPVQESQAEPLVTKDYISMLSIAVFLLLLFLLWIVDSRQRKTERKT